jgi:hypothetical protein
MNEAQVLDGMVELIVGRIEIPEPGADWREAMRRRATSAREVLSQHSSVIALLEASGLSGPAAMRYRDAILGNLMEAGFPIEYAAHAFSLLDSYVYGLVIQEVSMGPRTPESLNEPREPAAESRKSTAEPTDLSEYPHLTAVYEHALTFAYSFDGEFEFGLELILDGLERYRRAG